MSGINPGIFILGKYTGAFSKICCKCSEHDEVFYSSPTHLLMGKVGCSKCRSGKISNALLKDRELFVKQLKQINPTITIVGEYTGAANRIAVKCNKCNNEWNPVASSILSGFGCPRCSSSKGEKAIYEFLKENGLDFITQAKFSDLRGTGYKKQLPLSYDFYIQSLNLLIEYQGQFHDHTATIQTESGYKTQKAHDEMKRKYADEHGINLLEIWYYDFDKIEEILTEYINNLRNPVTTTAV